MRPHLNLRARHAATALGALCLAISLAALPGTARSNGTPAGHAAIAADIAPGKSRLNVLAGRQASVHGRVLSGAAGRPALLQRRSRSGLGDDRPRHHARRRRLRLRLPPAAVRQRPAARRSSTRRGARSAGSTSTAAPRCRGTAPACTATSCRVAGAWTPGTLGVAHKTLPCGTRVTLRRGDRVIRVRVVDRGPYVGGREFDLTSATRAKLHFGGVGSLLVAS